MKKSHCTLIEHTVCKLKLYRNFLVERYSLNLAPASILQAKRFPTSLRGQGRTKLRNEIYELLVFKSAER